MWGRAVGCVILLSLQEHLQGESTRYRPSALGSQIAGGLCVASILIDFRTFKLRKGCGLLFSTRLVISDNDADKHGYRHLLSLAIYLYPVHHMELITKELRIWLPNYQNDS